MKRILKIVCDFDLIEVTTPEQQADLDHMLYDTVMDWMVKHKKWPCYMGVIDSCEEKVRG